MSSALVGRNFTPQHFVSAFLLSKQPNTWMTWQLMDDGFEKAALFPFVVKTKNKRERKASL